MVIAPPPPDEERRLQALYSLHLLDTPAEERFDSVTRLAASTFQVPVAYVSLIDRDRQWFKSIVGIDLCETPRTVSFCSHAILREEALVVSDTLLDERFSGNPFVTGQPHVRFYAGKPLRAAGGERVGTLCIIDYEPHELSAAQLELFAQLVALAERELQMGDLIALQTNLLETQGKLLKTQAHLQEELAAAAAYVKSLIPAPTARPIKFAWRFLPSEELGGDCLGYHELDAEHVAIYLFDVCGHGVGAALLSVAMLSVLKSPSQQGVEFSNPAAVLGALNRQFQMEGHDHRFVTVWYGVLNHRTGRLAYASAGHPPAILIGPGHEPRYLSTNGIPIGCLPEVEFASEECLLTSEDVLYIFSDGVYEVRTGPRVLLPLDEFSCLLSGVDLSDAGALDNLLGKLPQEEEGRRFLDDVSLLAVQLPQATSK